MPCCSHLPFLLTPSSQSRPLVLVSCSPPFPSAMPLWSGIDAIDPSPVYWQCFSSVRRSVETVLRHRVKRESPCSETQELRRLLSGWSEKCLESPYYSVWHAVNTKRVACVIEGVGVVYLVMMIIRYLAPPWAKAVLTRHLSTEMVRESGVWILMIKGSEQSALGWWWGGDFEELGGRFQEGGSGSLAQESRRSKDFLGREQNEGLRRATLCINTPW